jgi:hypothetical protein
MLYNLSVIFYYKYSATKLFYNSENIVKGKEKILCLSIDKIVVLNSFCYTVCN